LAAVRVCRHPNLFFVRGKIPSCPNPRIKERYQGVLLGIPVLTLSGTLHGATWHGTAANCCVLRSGWVERWRSNVVARSIHYAV